MSDKQRPAGHQGVTKWGLKNTRANELGKGMAGGGMNYHTQDKTEAFLPEKGRLTVVGSAGGTGAVPPC